MKFSIMQTDLKSRLSVEGDSSFWTATDIKRWLNQAQIWVAKRKPWKILMTTAADDTIVDRNYYSFPSDYLYGTIFFINVNSIDYNYVDIATFLQSDFNTNNTFAVLGTKYYIHATPSTADLVINIYYQKRPPSLSNDNDESILQEELHEAIIARAEFIGWKRKKEMDLAGFALGDAKDIIRNMWTIDKKSFRGAKTVANILKNFPAYSASGNV